MGQLKRFSSIEHPPEGESHGDPGDHQVQILTGCNRGLGEGQTFWESERYGTEVEDSDGK